MEKNTMQNQILTFYVVGESGTYSAKGPWYKNDVINVSHVIKKEFGAVTVGLFHT